MKIRGIIFLSIFFIFCINGCGKKEEDIAQGLQWEKVDTEAESESADGEGTPGHVDKEGLVNPGGEGETGGDGAEESVPFVEGMIKDQSFETELDDWGKVFFASIAPTDGGGEPVFALLKNEEIVYTFPDAKMSTESKFTGVSAVAFRDYNQDGKKDVIVLVTYSDGGHEWNEPRVFLQENSDNMFYLDHPGLKSRRVEGAAESGPSFYRDTFLEEYLMAQSLTDSVALLAESWADYVDYADASLGMLSTERQIELFALNRAVWAKEVEYADDRYCFTIAGLTNDGRPTLIVSNQGGTGLYTYSEFYKIDKNGELKKLETSFQETDSQPDIIEESMTVYSSFSAGGIKNHFIVYDALKDSPDTYLYRVSSLNISDDFVMETPLASQRVVYEGEDYAARTTSEDCNGNTLTEEEYTAFPDRYYGSMGLAKKKAVFKWMDVESLKGMSDKEAQEALNQVYEGFSME